MGHRKEEKFSWFDPLPRHRQQYHPPPKKKKRKEKSEVRSKEKRDHMSKTHNCFQSQLKSNAYTVNHQKEHSICSLSS